MTTARAIINKAYRKNGIITKNEALSASEVNDGLSSLNDLLGSWSNEGLLVYADTLENFSFSTGQSSYTIGPGGDFNTSRPVKILTAYTRIGNTDYSMDLVPETTFDAITQKNISNAFPDVFSYSPGVPLGTLTFYPIPSGGTFFLRSQKPLTQFATLDGEVSLPPGWERALVYNLAVEDASEYGQPVDPVVFDIAQKSLGKIKTAIAKQKTMDVYAYKGNDSNIYTGFYK